MLKNKILLVIIALAFLFGSAKSQNLRLGTQTVSLGINYCDYSFSSTDFCYLKSYSGSMSGVSVVGSYNYAVLTTTNLGGSLGLSFLPGALAVDIGVDGEYHIHFGHRINKFDLYIPLNAGLAIINLQNNKVSQFGTLKADGIFYGLGLGVRKYFRGYYGAFLNGGYEVHKYIGGEVTESDKGKLPYSLSISGLYIGGGVCRRFGSAAHPCIDN